MAEQFYFFSVYLFLPLVFFLYTSQKIRHDIYVLQINFYSGKSFIAWVLANRNLMILNRRSLLCVLPVLFQFSLQLERAYICFASALIYVMLLVIRPKRTEKKALMFTPRIKRLMFTLSIIIALSVWMSFTQNILAALLVMTFINLFSFITVMMVNYMNLPIELFINSRHLKDAKAILRNRPDLVVIGITGSHGKSSTKYILDMILSTKYIVLTTSNDCGSMVEIVRTVRENLKAIHNIFICEMDVQKSGDIREMCKLLRPQMVILTSVGSPHMKVSNARKDIIKAQLEIIDEMPREGILFLNSDNQYISERTGLLPISGIEKTVYYGMNYFKGIDFAAKELRTSEHGMVFVVSNRDDDKAIFQTKLLGNQNMLSILASISVASIFGMNIGTISLFIKGIEPISHKLELISSGQLTMIDDTLNSTAERAIAALDVLYQFKDLKKILITPAMLESDGKIYEQNRLFGIKAADICDFIIFVGESCNGPIYEGLVEEQYPQNRIHIAKDLNAAISDMEIIAEQGGVVLLENDFFNKPFRLKA